MKKKAGRGYESWAQDIDIRDRPFHGKRCKTWEGKQLTKGFSLGYERGNTLGGEDQHRKEGVRGLSETGKIITSCFSTAAKLRPSGAQTRGDSKCKSK